jgi:CRP-like cAMP-binding protein
MSLEIASPYSEVDATRFESSPSALAAGQRYPPGVQVFAQGGLPYEVFYLAVGIVKMTRLNRTGREAILELVSSGSWLGTAAVIAQKASLVNAVTCTQCVLRRMSATAFRKRIETDQQLSREIHLAHARELWAQTSWMDKLSSLTAAERLGRMLYQFARVHAGSSNRCVRLDLPVHHWELAALISVTPEHLSRLLTDMQKEGILCRDKHCIRIPDIQRLCAPDDPDECD